MTQPSPSRPARPSHNYLGLLTRGRQPANPLILLIFCHCSHHSPTLQGGAALLTAVSNHVPASGSLGGGLWRCSRPSARARATASRHRDRRPWPLSSSSTSRDGLPPPAAGLPSQCGVRNTHSSSCRRQSVHWNDLCTWIRHLFATWSRQQRQRRQPPINPAAAAVLPAQPLHGNDPPPIPGMSLTAPPHTASPHIDTPRNARAVHNGSGQLS